MLIDKDVLKKTYLISLNKRMATLKELMEAYQSGDKEAIESILRIAHTLTGSGATFGFPLISEKARALEISAGEQFHEAFNALQAEIGQLLENDATPKRSILIIEDDLITQKMIANAVKAEFSEIDFAVNGGIAKNKIALRLYSAVLLDLMLPDMDGREVLIRLRENYSTFNTPVIVLSSITEAKHIKECYMLGADSYLTKPFDRELLVSTLNAKIAQAHKMTAGEDSYDISEIGNENSMMEKAEEWFAENPGRSPWLVMINLFEGAVRVADARLNQLATIIQKNLTGIRDLAHCSKDNLVLLFDDLSIEELKKKFAHCEEVLKREGGAEFEKISSIRIAARQPKNPDDLKNCSLILGNELASMQSETFCTVSFILENKKERFRILLAEDDNLIATLVFNRLGRDNLEFVRARDGDEALEFIEKEKFDLLLLDVKMPGMDGFQVLQSVRKKISNKELPIVMLTSMGKEKDIIRGFKLGADDYILKPFSPPEVLARINRLLRR
jgi:two-component system, cell cycle response regulator